VRQFVALVALLMGLVLLSGCRGTGPQAYGSPTGTPGTPLPTSSAAAHAPFWCGGPGSGGPALESGVTPRPVETADPDHLLCIDIQNK
jgi:hypothetical protein